MKVSCRQLGLRPCRSWSDCSSCGRTSKSLKRSRPSGAWQALRSGRNAPVEQKKAEGELDTLVPFNWKDAWDWRLAVNFLDRIDGHHKMRQLFEERRQLTNTLAKTYQELVAENLAGCLQQLAGQRAPGFAGLLERGSGHGGRYWRARCTPSQKRSRRDGSASAYILGDYSNTLRVH